MGLNFPGVDFGMKRMRNSRQLSGKRPSRNSRLNVSSITACMEVGRFAMMRKSILSIPGAALQFALSTAVCNSSSEKGGSRLVLLAHGVEGGGKLGKKHDWGHIVGISLRMFSCPSVLEREDVGSGIFLFRNFLILSQTLLAGERKSMVLVNSIQEFLFDFLKVLRAIASSFLASIKLSRFDWRLNVAHASFRAALAMLHSSFHQMAGRDFTDLFLLVGSKVEREGNRPDSTCVYDFSAIKHAKQRQ